MDRLKLARAALAAGLDLSWVDAVPSTQDVVRGWAIEGRAHGAALVAGRQTGGRGRLGRVWTAPPGAICVSILLRPTIAVRWWPRIALAAGVALTDALGDGVRLKWPNDAMIGAGKVAGVLAEAEPSSGAVVLGIGINAGAAPDLPGAVGLGVADPEGVAVDTVAAVLARVAQLSTEPGALLAVYRARCATIGARVRVADRHGVGIDVDDQGALKLRDGDGVVHRILAGDVEMIGGLS